MDGRLVVDDARVAQSGVGVAHYSSAVMLHGSATSIGTIETKSQPSSDSHPDCYWIQT